MNDRTTLIRGGHLIDPAQHVSEPRDLLLREGRVAEVVAPGKLAKADEIIEAKGMIVAPGLIDLHVHLREPGQSHKETIATGTAAAAAGGFTSVCAMPNTTPVNDNPAITRWMQDPERNAVVNVFPVAAATVGSAGEKLTDFAALYDAGAVAISDDGKPLLNDNLMLEAMALSARTGVVVIQHAEDTRLTKNAPMNESAVAFRLGLRGYPSAAEWKVIERDIRLAHAMEGWLHIAHLSAAQSLEMVRLGKKAGVRVTAEVCPHHFMFTDENCSSYDTRYKMNPPLRTAEDREALLVGLADGTVDAIATDHAPHALYEKEVEFDRAANGITGLEVALAATLNYLHRERKVSLERVVELLSTNPAKIVKLEGRGTLAEGSHADVVIFNPKKKWTYDVRKTLSKSRNAPYDGMEFYGKVAATIVGGEVVYEG
jgi:dihydroorotase